MEVSPRHAAWAAYAAAGLNLMAGVAMLVWLEPGLPVEGSRLPDRMAYLSGHRAAWWGGWLLWHAAAISLLGFFVGLAGLWRRRAPIHCDLALLCGAAGLAADLGAESLYMAVAPGLGPEAFETAERVAGVLTGYLGNGLYTIAGVLLTWAGAGELPRPLLALGAAVWAAGFGLSAATLVHSAPGQFWSTAALMPLFILWAGFVGRWIGGPGNPTSS